MLCLDDFDVGVTLGTGSFGRVRFATYKSNPDQACAIKMLKKCEVVRMHQEEHMNCEKAILEAISKGTDLKPHPFIVNLFATFQDDYFLYMVLEYVNGGEFFTHLRKYGRLDNSQAKFYCASVTLIFQHLHAEDVIYRDLKPENLLLDCDGFMKITDFGFAKKVMFKTYTLCGTPEYIAPEVLLNKGHGKGVDWWTLGILMYEMLSGGPPFVNDDPMCIYQQILAGTISFPRFFDRQAKMLIKKLLNSDLTKRFGCLKRGAEDIKDHSWFNGFHWKELLDKQVSPPIRPEVSGPCDVCQFDQYPDTITEPIQYKPNTGEEDPFADFDTIVTDFSS